MSTKKMRARLTVKSLTHHEFDRWTVVLQPVCHDETPEAERFHKWTPDGEVRLDVTNPACPEFFKPGQDFYADFTPVPEGREP